MVKEKPTLKDSKAIPSPSTEEAAMIVVQDTLLSQSTSLSEDHLIPKTVSGIQLFSSPTGGLDSTARTST